LTGGDVRGSCTLSATKTATALTLTALSVVITTSASASVALAWVVALGAATVYFPRAFCGSSRCTLPTAVLTRILAPTVSARWAVTMFARALAILMITSTPMHIILRVSAAVLITSFGRRISSATLFSITSLSAFVTRFFIPALDAWLFFSALGSRLLLSAIVTGFLIAAFIARLVVAPTVITTVITALVTTVLSPLLAAASITLLVTTRLTAIISPVVSTLSRPLLSRPLITVPVISRPLITGSVRAAGDTVVATAGAFTSVVAR
jgi:hypothetical protein